MPFVKPPIDFSAIRRALVAELAEMTGLPRGQVIYEEPEDMDAPRPSYPYLGVMVLQAAGMVSPDFYLPIPDAPGRPTGLFSYTGERQMSVTISAYARTHEQAYSIGCALQALLQQIPTRDALRAQGLTVWSVGDVTNISEMLNTGYEGRSEIDITFALVSTMTVDMGYLGQIPISGGFDSKTTDTFNAKGR